MTSVKITATVPMDLDAKDVRACVVREGVTLDAPGFETRRIELPFMLSAPLSAALANRRQNGGQRLRRL